MTRPRWVCAGLAVALVVAVLAGLTSGAAHLTVRAVWDALRAGPRGGSGDDAQTAALIVWGLRGPRLLLAALSGASLALAGVAFQSLLRNDLADPYLIGVSAGASVGAELVLLTGTDTAARSAGASAAGFGTATVAVGTVYALARQGGRVVVSSLLLGGVVVSSLLGAVSLLLLTFARPDDLARVQYRLNGSFQDASGGQCTLVGGFLALGLAVLTVRARDMNVLAMGEEAAQQLGVDVERLKTLLLVTGSLLTAATVAAAGIIGFVGLVVPHAARRLCGTPDTRAVLVPSVLGGAALLAAADTAARTVLDALGRGAAELPVGVVTALVGAPFFLYLLRRSARRG